MNVLTFKQRYLKSTGLMFQGGETYMTYQQMTFIDGLGEKQSPLYRGGFPCQPHSVAGKRKASADERDLWPEYRRVVGEFKPGWVVAENVRGLLSVEDGRFFRGILRDFANMGYDVGWCCFRAADAGAIHARERIAIIAHDISDRIQGSGNEQICREQGFQSCEMFRRLETWQERSDLFEPKLCRSYNGIPDGVDRLKALGNAVVPQQFEPIFKAIAEIEKGREEHDY